jgi:hypothetical protein
MGLPELPYCNDGDLLTPVWSGGEFQIEAGHCEYELSFKKVENAS